MRFSTNAPKTITLSAKECFGYGGTLLTFVAVCIGATWSVFTYTGGKYDYMIERQDRLHKETRDHNEKMIENKIASLGNQLVTQIGGIDSAINTTQTLILNQSDVVIDQVEKTAINKAELTSVKEKLKEEDIENQELEQEVNQLQVEVKDIKVTLKEEAISKNSSIEPANGPFLQLRPALMARQARACIYGHLEEGMMNEFGIDPTLPRPEICGASGGGRHVGAVVHRDLESGLRRHCLGGRFQSSGAGLGSVSTSVLPTAWPVSFARW